jgi:hypothetical protein
MRTPAPFVLLLGLAAAPAAIAEPTVIRDNRLADLAITPTLGRGHSPGANSLHGVCFDTMPTTAASFDFDYAFAQLDADSAFSDREISEFVRSYGRDRIADKSGGKVHVQYLLATLTVDSYYASIDESRARLSESAQTLLRNGDLLGFFAGCGTHYVRSLSRRSYFLTMFSYTAKDHDAVFERSLEQHVRRLELAGPRSAEEVSAEEAFATQARSRDLKIVCKAIGLRAQKSAVLVPVDLASYKESLKQAFEASQDELTGRITAGEVTPWLATPIVLAAIDLDGGEAVEVGRRFRRKQLLADNAEFYVAMVEQDRAVEALVHKAFLCRAALESQVLDGGTLPEQHARAALVSHRDGHQLEVAKMLEVLSDRNLAALQEAERAFELGGDSGGAASCVEELGHGLLDRSHVDIPACARLHTPSLPGAALIDEYCMPQLVEEVKP